MRTILLFVLYLGATSAGLLDNKHNEGIYLENFETLISRSYAVPLPDWVTNNCKDQGLITTELATTNVQSATTLNSNDIQTQCGSNTHCVVTDTHVEMTGNLNLASLTLKGTTSFDWNEATTSSSLNLCTGFFLAMDGTVVTINLQTLDGLIYIKDNNLNSNLGKRVFGGVGSTIDITGREMARTWSLLASAVNVGESSIQLVHNPMDMGWRVGDRIVMSPTSGYDSYAESFIIQALEPDNYITLGAVNHPFFSDGTTTKNAYHATMFWANDNVGLKSAEVMNMDRNFIITGDDFRHEECDPSLPNENTFMG